MSTARERAVEILRRWIPDMPTRDANAFVDAIVELVQEEQHRQFRMAHFRVFGETEKA